jgi:hypothetical protein
MLPPVLATLVTIRAARRVRKDLVLTGPVRLGAVSFGNGTHSLGSILRGDVHKEEWRFLQSLDQSSPWDSYADSINPGFVREVQFQGNAAVGMLWANENGSIVLSFAIEQIWSSARLIAQLHEINEAGNIVPTDIEIPNLSNVNHVVAHRQLLINYGVFLSATSLVYRGEGFDVRMFFNDHNPPHFHVMQNQTADTLARYAIRTLDRLSGKLSPAIERRVREWAAPKTQDLLANWERCRARTHLVRLED